MKFEKINNMLYIRIYFGNYNNYYLVSPKFKTFWLLYILYYINVTTFLFSIKVKVKIELSSHVITCYKYFHTVHIISRSSVD